MIGKVKIIRAREGWGFVRTEDNKDVFFHQKDFTDGTSISDIQEGDRLGFEVSTNDRGFIAREIKRFID